MTEPYRLEPNRRFQLDGRVLTYKRFHKGEDRPYVFEDAAGYPFVMSAEELQTARASNALLDWQPSSTAAVRDDVVLVRAPITTDSAREKELFELQRRLAYVHAWLEHRPSRSARALRPLIAQVYERRRAQACAEGRFEPPSFSVSSLQKFLQHHLGSGGHGNCLVPQTRRRGNYRQRLSTTVLDIVRNQIDESYLVRNGQCVAGLHRLIVKDVEHRNRKVRASRTSGGYLLPSPSYEAVARVIGRLCQYTVLYCREGAEAANVRYRLIGNGIVTERPNEIWEIDDTRTDLICTHVDGKTVIGRPWMTVVIDRHTRMIMGISLTFSPPDTETALDAVRMAIKNKKRLLERYPELKGAWPAEGLPDAIHVDNGSQYNSEAFKRALAKLGIQHKTMPVLKAWFKGTVERLIGTVMRQVFHLVPGTTHSSVYERDRDIPPELVAETTLAEAYRLLLAWVVNDYNHRHHRGIKASPFAIWQADVERYPLKLPPTSEQVDAALSITVARQVRNGRIRLDGLTYLTADGLRMEMARRGSTDLNVIVRRDPGDLTVIHLLDAGVTDLAVEHWHPAIICPKDRPIIEGRVLAEYRLAKVLRRSDPDLQEYDEDWTATYDAVEVEQERDAGGDRLVGRVRAEGARERVVRQTQRRVEGMIPAEPGHEEQSIQARLEGHDQPQVEPATPPTAASPVDPEEAFLKLRQERGTSSRRDGTEKA